MIDDERNSCPRACLNVIRDAFGLLVLKNKLFQTRKIRMNWALFPLILLSLLGQSAWAEETVFDMSKVIPRPRELQGNDFVPDDVVHHPGLANWDQLRVDSNELVVSKLRIVGFEKYANGKTVDWSTDDPKILRLVQAGLRLSNMRRNAVSDCTDFRAGVGLGAHIGVLEVTFKDKPLIIGVSQTGFFLGTWHGCTHQSFESWILAKELDNRIKELTGKHLEENAFDALSGEGVLKRSKAAFEDTAPDPLR